MDERVYYFETDKILESEELMALAFNLSAMINDYGVIVANPSLKLKAVLNTSSENKPVA